MKPCRPARLRLAVALLVAAVSAATLRAVTITASQVTPTTWVYDLTFAPMDNYSIFQPVTTITLTGLSGVTSAAGPTATTFPNPYGNTVNLAWTAQVLNGGTTVVWSHNGGGTGNYNDPMSVTGFSVIATGAVNGLALLSTSGFSRDVNSPLPGGGFNLDISGFLAGPVSVPEPSVVCLFAVGALAVVRGFSRNRTR